MFHQCNHVRVLVRHAMKCQHRLRSVLYYIASQEISHNEKQIEEEGEGQPRELDGSTDVLSRSCLA